jgi:hypothetical protein
VAGNVIRLEPEQLADALESGEEHIRAAIARGALAGAHRGRALIVPRTPTDMGQLRASWKVNAGTSDFSGGVTGIGATLAELYNDAPHVGIVELGSRPHGVSPEGWAAIYEWVRRHYRGAVNGAGVRTYTLGGRGSMRPRTRGAGQPGPFKGDDPDITAITNAIVQKIRREGTKPTLFIQNSMEELREVMAAELHRAIAIAVRDQGRGQ